MNKTQETAHNCGAVKEKHKMLDLFELQKDITLGKKIIVAPKEAEDSDLAAIADCIKGGQDIALDLSETKITRLGAEFGGCKALKAIVLPKGVTSIGNYAFCGCEALTSILIPASVTSIGDEAFQDCWGLADKDGFVIVRDILFGYIGNAQSAVIPEGVTSIGSYAFEGCALEQVTIPASVKDIGLRPFAGCGALAKIDVASENKDYTSVDGVLFSKDKKTLVYFPAGKSADYYEIPEGVTSIGFTAFEECSSLVQVAIPEGVTSIEYMAFALCRSLMQVEIPASVTYIEDCAFEWCSSLTAIVIPASVTSIGYMAFDGCTALTHITFADTSGWYFDKDFTRPAGASELASSLKGGKELYKEAR